MKRKSATLRRLLPALLLLLVPGIATANPPDLTAGGVPNITRTTNLGPTGMRGWVYHVKDDTNASRQILVTAVAAGSPAAGVLAPDDVILGANGTGANPVNFTYDARRALADAINDAEARAPATLKLLRWRDGTTTTVTLTLQTMGAYSATAPYDCPKSALILQQGLAAIMAGESAGRYSFGTITLLAGNDPSDPGNAARMARAQTEARALIPSAAQMAQMMSDERDATSMITWQRGHTLIVLAEYFLLTGDEEVLPAIEAYAVNIARNSSLFGTMGHIFAEKNLDGSDNGPMGGAYGPVNNAGLPCFLGLLLARECGIDHPGIDPAIERMNRFYGYYVGKGAIPYGEHDAFWQSHENNGKSGLAAVCYALQDDQAERGNYYAKMATASTTGRERGHTGAFFNYVWAPLGAASGGEEAAATHFADIRWMLDLNRRWDSRFDYDCLNEGPHSGSQYNDFRMSTAALLTYALPLRQLRVTGKNHDPARWLASSDVAEAAAVDGYSATPRTTNDLIADLGSWSPMVQRRAALELATRSINTATLNQITALANDPNGNSRVGACLTLGRINNSSTANARAATLAGLLADPENHVRFMAAEAMRYLPQDARMSQLDAILSAAASTAMPLFPLDDEDPLHFAHGRLAMLLFYSGNAYGPRGVIWGNRINSPTVIDRNLLYPAIRAVAANPVGMARSCLTETYRNLTAADVNALAGSIVDSVRLRAPADKMFSGGVRIGGLDALEKFKIAEGVPLSMISMVDDGRNDAYNHGLNLLKKYAGGSTTVTPDPDVIGFCRMLLDTSRAAAAQEVLDAIAADPNPAPLTPFKSIQSVTADATSLNLPANQTTLRVAATDFADGDTVFTWRKVHGAGEVAFTPNGTAGSKDAVIGFDGVPGQYLFEVTMSDSRGLTEVYGTVAVTLRNPDGSLPPNDPPTAHPQIIATSPGAQTPITLTGSDPEGFPLVFAVTSQPAHGTLSGSPPDLVYTSGGTYLGPDSFTFQAIDSEGQTDTATISINVANVGVQMLVHEPFDYPAGGLNGRGGTSDIGFAGPWHASTSAQVATGSLSYGDLTVSGGSIGNLNGGSNNYGGSRTISASALAENGLLDDGATLWFSVIMGYGSGGNVTNSRLAFALANSSFNTGNYRYYINNEGSQLGSGLGVTLGRINGTNGKIVATQFRDASHGTSGWDGNVFGNVPVATLGGGQHRLVVGKMIWGAESDTIELFLPDENLDIHAPVSTLTVNVDQSTFDTITWARGDVVTMDEIRFGNSLAAVLGIESAPPDTDPPTLVSIADDRDGEIMQQGETVGYTLVFSEAMASATIDASLFGNAGSADIVINSVNQPLPEIVTVQLTPLTAGTIQFQIVQDALLTDLAGNLLDTSQPITDATVITVNAAMVDVPFVIGMPQADAESAITDAGLVPGSVSSIHHQSIPAGSVIAQDPAEGTSVNFGSSVNLTVSLGPEMAMVPSVAGLTQSAAEDAIIAAGLAVGTLDTEFSDTIPTGEIISQNPLGGVSVSLGSAVDLVVSLGADTPPESDGTWAVNDSGNWSDAANWLDEIVASGSGRTATISMAGTGNRTITVDADHTIGHIARNWAANNILTIGGSNTLTLAGPSPTITNHDAANNRRIEITAPLAGSDGLHIAGGGMVWLRNNGTNYSGPTTVNGFLNFEGIAIANIGGGAAAGRNITVTAGSAVRFNALGNAVLNRIVETTAEITVMTGTTGNSLDFSSSTGANLPNAFLGNWASNGAKMDFTGMITPAGDHYRFGSPLSDGLLTIASNLSGPQGVLIGGNRVQLSGTNTHTGTTFVRDGARLVLANGNAMQHSPLDTGTPSNTGLLTLSNGTGGGGAAGTGAQATPNPVLGGLTGSRNLHAMIQQGNATATNHGSAGNNTGTLALNSITGITLNPGGDLTFTYSGSIANIADSTTAFALTKTGSGTQVFSGNHSYSGTTVIEDGTLAFDGGSTASPITVEDGASIGFSLDSPTTSTSTLDLTEGTVKIIGTVDDASDFLLMTASSITGVPTLDEPIPGYELRLQNDDTELVLAFIGDAATPYETWSGGIPFDGDANGDGMPDGLAFLLGADSPDDNANHLRPVGTPEVDGFEIRFRMRNAASRGTATLSVQWSRDLGITDPWVANSAAIPETSGTIDGIEFTITPDGDDHHQVVATIPNTHAPDGRLFVRLSGTEN